MTTVVVRSKACTVVTLGSWVGIPLGAYMYLCICVVVVVVVVIAADAVSRDVATVQFLLKTVFRRRHLERKEGRKTIFTVNQ
jgi:hypothetical protein